MKSIRYQNGHTIVLWADDITKVEKRKFDPHLTLARIKPSKGKARGIFKILKQELDSIPPIDVGFFQVSFVRLVQSELTPEGPIYTILDEFFLKSDV